MSRQPDVRRSAARLGIPPLTQATFGMVEALEDVVGMRCLALPNASTLPTATRDAGRPLHALDGLKR